MRSSEYPIWLVYVLIALVAIVAIDQGQREALRQRYSAFNLTKDEMQCALSWHRSMHDDQPETIVHWCKLITK